MWSEIVSPLEEVASTLYEWRLDQSVLAASFQTDIQDKEVFLRNLRADYFSLPDLPPFFMCIGGEKVAFIRFRPFKEKNSRAFIRSAEISIIVHPQKRRMGIGTKALEFAASFAQERVYHELFAQIRLENEPSRKLFEKAGYCKEEENIFVREELEGTVRVPMYLYKKNLIPPFPFPHVFLVAEIGSNYQMSTRKETLQAARDLIEMAALSGVDAVKFQTFRAKTTYAPHAGGSTYLQNQDIEELFEDLQMLYEDIPYLSELARSYGLTFMSTAFSVEDFARVDPYVSYHKVASYELAYTPLLTEVAKSGKPVFVSTGASSMHEIAYAVHHLKEQGCSKIVLLQCTAAYPAQTSCMHLATLPVLRQAFGVDVGLSDHSLDAVVAPVMSVAMGACVIEKHITLDRTLPGPDQKFALEGDELSLFVRQIRTAEAMKGTSQKQVFDDERELFLFAKRRLQASCFIEEGEIIVENVNAALLRPGNNSPGDHPSFVSSIYGKKALRKIMPGEGITKGDVR
jgi:sialic acid synthase SpsE/RimJ/RimL family protein N-acetyltransferase